MITLLRRTANGCLNQPIPLLLFTMLLWAGNTVAGRMAVGEVSPMVLIFLRWVIAGGAIIAFAHRPLRQDWPVLKTRLPFVFIMGSIGYTIYNAIFYIAAQHTTAVNLSIIQGALPIFVLAGAVLILRSPMAHLQWIGALMTLIGVALVAVGGDLTSLHHMSFNTGDGFMIFACLLYAIYTLNLRNKPSVSALSLFAAMGLAALIVTLPFLSYEILTGTAQWPSFKGWMILLYIGLGPSFLAQVSFMRGVEMLGAGRAGVFYNLIPVLGAFLAVLILNEPFHLHHAIALMLVLGGIYIGERFAHKA